MLNRLLLVAFLIVWSLVDLKAQTPLGEDGNQFKLSSGYNIEGIPIYITYEFGILPDISFGLEGSYRAYSEQTDTGSLSHNIVGFSFFSNYYFNKLLNIPTEKYFFYGGLNIGYFKWFSPDNYFKPGKSSSTLAIGAQIGGIVFFDKWGINLEVTGGTENAGGKLGAVYRFNY